MFQAKPVLILKTLQSSELRRFADFLQSPALNKNQKVSEVLDVLRRFHPEYTHPDLERNALFKLLFPDETYDEKKLRYALTDLAKSLEEFLIQEQFRSDSFHRQQLLLHAYKDRGLDKYYHSTFKNLKRSLDAQDLRDVRYHHRAFKLEEEFFQFSSSRKSHQANTNLQQVVDNLDIYFLANKLKYSCEIINNKSVVNVDYELFLLEPIQSYLMDRDLSRFPSIAIYHQILLTLTNPDEKKHYTTLLNLLQEHRNCFEEAEIFDMYVYAKNYCIIKINKGDTSYNRELFEFYKIILSNRIIFRDGQLTQWDYKNIVTLGLRLRQYDWTERFMEEYKSALAAPYRENVWSFNMANLMFHKEDYDQTLALLQEVEFTDVYYHLDSKTLLLKTYYALEEWDSLQSLIDSLKVYLKRNKLVPQYQRTVYGNLFLYSNRLIRYRRGRKLDLDQLAKDIEETREIANINWLRDAVEALRKPNPRSA